jgi:hypothetical protein
MDHRIRREKKTYAMRRMADAIGRAIAAGSGAEQARAARWAAAWGAAGGIRSPGIRLRRDVLGGVRRARR